jgi:hypothetical protein
MRGRVPYERIGRFGRPPAAVDGFYVHPRTGLLLDTRSAARRRASKPAAPVTRKILDDWTEFRWIHGACFEIALVTYDSIVPRGDALVREARDPRAEFARLYGRPRVYAARKRQLEEGKETAWPHRAVRYPLTWCTSVHTIDRAV